MATSITTDSRENHMEGPSTSRDYHADNNVDGPSRQAKESKLDGSAGSKSRFQSKSPARTTTLTEIQQTAMRTSSPRRKKPAATELDSVFLTAEVLYFQTFRFGDSRARKFQIQIGVLTAFCLSVSPTLMQYLFSSNVLSHTLNRRVLFKIP